MLEMSSKAKSNSVKHSLEALKQKFPRYFIVDGDTPVKIDFDASANEIFALARYRSPYPPLKALIEGEEVELEEFRKYNIV